MRRDFLFASCRIVLIGVLAACAGCHRPPRPLSSPATRVSPDLAATLGKGTILRASEVPWQAHYRPDWGIGGLRPEDLVLDQAADHPLLRLHMNPHGPKRRGRREAEVLFPTSRLPGFNAVGHDLYADLRGQRLQLWVLIPRDEQDAFIGTNLRLFVVGTDASRQAYSRDLLLTKSLLQPTGDDRWLRVLVAFAPMEDIANGNVSWTQLRPDEVAAVSAVGLNMSAPPDHEPIDGEARLGPLTMIPVELSIVVPVVASGATDTAATAGSQPQSHTPYRLDPVNGSALPWQAVFAPEWGIGGLQPQQVKIDEASRRALLHVELDAREPTRQEAEVFFEIRNADAFGRQEVIDLKGRAVHVNLLVPLAAREEFRDFSLRLFVVTRDALKSYGQHLRVTPAVLDQAEVVSEQWLRIPVQFDPEQEIRDRTASWSQIQPEQLRATTAIGLNIKVDGFERHVSADIALENCSIVERRDVNDRSASRAAVASDPLVQGSPLVVPAASLPWEADLLPAWGIGGVVTERPTHHVSDGGMTFSLRISKDEDAEDHEAQVQFATGASAAFGYREIVDLRGNVLRLSVCFPAEQRAALVGGDLRLFVTATPQLRKAYAHDVILTEELLSRAELMNGKWLSIPLEFDLEQEVLEGQTSWSELSAADIQAVRTIGLNIKNITLAGDIRIETLELRERDRRPHAAVGASDAQEPPSELYLQAKRAADVNEKTRQLAGLVQRYPRSDEARRAEEDLIDLLGYLGQEREALGQYDAYLSAWGNGESVWMPLYRRGMLLKQTRRYEEALAMYRAVLSASEPWSAVQALALVGAMDACVGLGRFEEAMAIAHRYQSHLPSELKSVRIEEFSGEAESITSVPTSAGAIRAYAESIEKLMRQGDDRPIHAERIGDVAHLAHLRDVPIYIYVIRYESPVSQPLPVSSLGRVTAERAAALIQNVNAGLAYLSGEQMTLRFDGIEHLTAQFAPSQPDASTWNTKPVLYQTLHGERTGVAEHRDGFVLILDPAVVTLGWSELVPHEAYAANGVITAIPSSDLILVHEILHGLGARHTPQVNTASRMVRSGPLLWNVPWDLMCNRCTLETTGAYALHLNPRDQAILGWPSQSPLPIKPGQSITQALAERAQLP